MTSSTLQGCGSKKMQRINKRQGYSQGNVDHTMFFKRRPNGKIVVLIVYVDDVILIGNDTEIEENEEFESKDLGALKQLNPTSMQTGEALLFTTGHRTYAWGTLV